MNRFHFYIFLLIVFTVYFLIHYFVYFRIVKTLNLSIPIRTLLKIFFFISAISFFLNKTLMRHYTLYPIATYGSIWLGTISIAFTIFILEYILALIFPSLSKKITIAAILLSVALSGLSVYIASLPPKIKKIKIPVRGLSSESQGFSIVQLSDLHLENSKSKKWLKGIVDNVNRLSPDIIVITGDLVDSDIDGRGKFVEILRQLDSRHGVYAITGNHEYYAGIKEFLEFSKRSNITVLRNEKISINGKIEILGIEDESAEMIKGGGPDLESARKGCDFNKPVVLLSHKPKYFKEATELGVDLQLSGHTHAGQIPPMDLIVFLVYKYPYGLYRYKSSYIYTTSGTGIWGPPMRLFSRSEIVNIELISKGEEFF